VGSYPAYSQLRTMSEAGVIERLDRIVERSEPGVQYYLAELTRRELAWQTTILERLSWLTALLIFVVTMLAVALVLNC
jgi:hypothetical protein